MSIKYYTADHEWVLIDNNTATIGITDHAQHSLGEIVYIELPDSGQTIHPGDCLATIESVKAASDILAPLAGTVIEINQRLLDQPEQVNVAAESSGWFVKMTLSNSPLPDCLISLADYHAILE